MDKSSEIYRALKNIPAIQMKQFLKKALENPYGFSLDDMPEDMLIRLATIHDITPNTRGHYYPDAEMTVAFTMLLDDISKMTKKAFLNGNSIEDPDSWSYSHVAFDPVHLGPEITALFRDALCIDVARYSDGTLSLYLTESEVTRCIPLLKRIMGATEIGIHAKGESEYELEFVDCSDWDLKYRIVYNRYGRSAVESGEEHVNDLWWLDTLELKDGYDLVECGEGIYRVEKYDNITRRIDNTLEEHNG